MNPGFVLVGLRELIALCKSEDELDEIYVADKSADIRSEFVDAFTELDKWLGAGGQPPSAWRATEMSG
ncbi:hypothetical protein [Nocardia iowensis]|uniref:Uncharacterized protein n=1 Tax=Nocardia iowensis TaxID=204891 RepID=A0ABX8RL33_NOCIO|nr:hypothetical protein [Nocardia iowensis]QXN90283.1 hypothetical protein KV110_33465 [Nocardia iowensis]